MKRAIWGRLLGVIFGFLILGPIGAIAGFFLGLWADNAFARQQNTPEVQAAFFSAMFTTMGHLAKVDGHVSQNEIEVARQVMQHLQLSFAQTREAMRLFNQGKDPGFDIYPPLLKLKNLCQYRRNVLRMFMQMQMMAAFADGQMNTAESQLLQQVALTLGFGESSYQRMKSMYQAQYHFQQRFSQQGGYQQSDSGSYQQQETVHASAIHDAYALLGVDKGASMDEVKKAYRQLMNQYHPDKLAAKGLPESMLKAATEKTQQIKAAYELIKKYQKS